MFDIKIGTMIQAALAPKLVPQLNGKGFESYELTFKRGFHNEMDLTENAKIVLDAAEGRKISAVGLYGNTLLDEQYLEGIKVLIENARLYGCDIVSVFAGGNPAKSVPDNIPMFKKVFDELCARAEYNGVKIAVENCGHGWFEGCTNIGFCEEGWELMFDAVHSDALGLEWEPAHQVLALIDPIPQLRRWAEKIVHIHGKDGHIAWDILRKHGDRGIVPYAFSRTPGFGDTDWRDIFTILIQNGFEGYCDIEGYHDIIHYDDMEWTSQVTALEYLKRCRGGLEYFEGPKEYRGYQGKRK